jgi:hypothetical protein
MADNNGLNIEYRTVGKASRATLTATLGDDVLAVETVDLAKPAKREAFAESLCAGRQGIDREALNAKLLKMAADVASAGNGDPADSADATPESAELLAKMPETVRADADAFLRDENLLGRIVDDMAVLGIAGEKVLATAVYLIGTSRLLDDPLAGIVQGPSSSGKSYVADKVATAFPPETVILATQMTAQALFYMPPGSLSHRFVVAGERSRAKDDDAAEATRALREMLSAGRLSKLVTMQEQGEMITRHIEQEGPIAYVESTTATDIFNEDANRCLLLHTDERGEQTRRIVRKIAASHAGKVSGDQEGVRQRHHAMQRMLQKMPVVVPYAERLGELFTTNRVEVRRAFPQTLAMIQASTLLHQHQRKVDLDGRLLATADDYRVARHLLAGPMGRLLTGQLTDGGARYFERLTDWAKSDFTTTEAVRKENFSDRMVRDWLRELQRHGAVKLVEEHRGTKPAVWRLTGDSPEAGGPDGPALPAVEDVCGE